nr:putative polyprotein [Tanacetum cinerariifolium]
MVKPMKKRKKYFKELSLIITCAAALNPTINRTGNLKEKIKSLTLKGYEMVLDSDGIASKTTKENVKSLALKAKVTREQTSDDSDSQDGSDEDVYEEEAEAFNLIAKNFYKFFCKRNRFGRDNRFGNYANRFGGGRGNGFGNKGGESSKQKEVCYNCEIESHFAKDWIVDSGFTKHMTGNKRLFTSYKAYDGRHVVFGSNLKGKVFGG